MNKDVSTQVRLPLGCRDIDGRDDTVIEGRGDGAIDGDEEGAVDGLLLKVRDGD